MYHSVVCLNESADVKHAQKTLQDMKPLSNCGRSHWILIEHATKLSVEQLQTMACKIGCNVDQIAPRNIQFPQTNEMRLWYENVKS